MIPQRYITAWRKQSPWKDDRQVEQDLVIERVLSEIFSDNFLKSKLVIRRGTALHKIYLRPQVRYSEDIDLVQTEREPIKETLRVLREKLSFLAAAPVVKQKRNNNTLLFRFQAEDDVRMRLKVEINCREHFSVFGYKKVPFKVASEWYSGQAEINTFSIEELLGTKLRALYQRKKEEICLICGTPLRKLKQSRLK